MKEIKYQAIWAKGYILLGALFSCLFIISALTLNDYTIFFNLIASGIVIYIGYSMYSKPYIRYDQSQILVYGFLGGIRKEYSFKNKEAIKVREERFYLKGKKLKLNHWMVDKKDWQRMKAYFDEELEMLHELI